MADILATICQATRSRLAEARQARPLASLRAQLGQAPPLRDVLSVLRAGSQPRMPALIAEIKRASPSKGMIRPNDFDPARLARDYQAGGAAALSVLTEPDFFQGSPDYLKAARRACDLPILRKDFILDPYQLVEARLWGADMVLLIVAALRLEELAGLRQAARDLGLAVLLEVHDEAELQTAARLADPPEMIGVNNRNLVSFVTDLAVFERLAPLVSQTPDGPLLVAESGIGCTGDMRRLARAGAIAALVGESLMRSSDVTEATRLLLGQNSANGEDKAGIRQG